MIHARFKILNDTEDLIDKKAIVYSGTSGLSEAQRMEIYLRYPDESDLL
jgi:hypothetical protein